MLDRDPPPPDLDPDQAFHDWTRRGVAQLRHSHVFLGRLVAMLRDRHPALWETLVAAGAREFTFGDAAPPALRDTYVFAPGDEKLSFLFSRRTTLELIMRRYAASLPGVDFVTEVFVNAIDTTPLGGLPAVSCVRGVKDDEGNRLVRRRVCGRHRPNHAVPEWLRAAGAVIEEEESPAGIIYFTRHYRLHEGAVEPDRGIAQGAGDLGYIKYGVFAADNRHFSITLACPEIEDWPAHGFAAPRGVRPGLRADARHRALGGSVPRRAGEQSVRHGELKSVLAPLRTRWRPGRAQCVPDRRRADTKQSFVRARLFDGRDRGVRAGRRVQRHRRSRRTG